jgi:hypothetical protein
MMINQIQVMSQGLLLVLPHHQVVELLLHSMQVGWRLLPLLVLQIELSQQLRIYKQRRIDRQSLQQHLLQ